MGLIENILISLLVKSDMYILFGKALKHLRIKYPKTNCKVKKAFVFKALLSGTTPLKNAPFQRMGDFIENTL